MAKANQGISFGIMPGQTVARLRQQSALMPRFYRHLSTSIGEICGQKPDGSSKHNPVFIFSALDFFAFVAQFAASSFC